MTRPRALGYKLLGPAFDYLLHLRPAEWPIFAAHFLTGTLLATGFANLLEHAGSHLLLGTLAFTIGVNGGTLALNSAFDKDEGDIAYLRNPPPAPRGLALFGLLLMAFAVVAAHRVPRAFLAPVFLCIILSILYSVPPIRLKAVAGVDWIINMAGFGFLTPYAGWTLSHHPLTPAGRVLLVSFALLFGGLYPLTQLYQLEDDRRKGDRTFAVVLGLDRSLLVALGCTALAFAGFGSTALNPGWPGASDAPLRWAALALAALAWAAVLLPWWRHRHDWTPEEHQRGMHRALGAWAVTDLAVLYAFAR